MPHLLCERWGVRVRKEESAKARPSCHELRPDLLVVSISCADRSADLASRRASAVHIDVGRSFTHRLHDFCKVRAGRNALAVGSNTLAALTVPETVPEVVSGHAGGFGKPAGGPPIAPAAGPQRNTMIPAASLGKPKWMCEK